MRLEQQIGGDRCFHLFGREDRKTWLRVWADVGVRPSIKATLLDAGQIIRWKPITQSIPLLDKCKQLARLGVECEGGRIAHAGRERRLVRSVRIETLDRSLGFGLYPKISR